LAVPYLAKLMIFTRVAPHIKSQGFPMDIPLFS
jgi:hypothetical protein